MLTAYLKRRGLAGFANVAALAAAGAALAWNPVDGTAAPHLDAPRQATVRDARVQDVDLEQLFWICDHAATTRMVDASERAVCGAVAEQLKMEKFGGDFEDAELVAEEQSRSASEPRSRRRLEPGEVTPAGSGMPYVFEAS